VQLPHTDEVASKVEERASSDARIAEVRLAGCAAVDGVTNSVFELVEVKSPSCHLITIACAYTALGAVESGVRVGHAVESTVVVLKASVCQPVSVVS